MIYDVVHLVQPSQLTYTHSPLNYLTALTPSHQPICIMFEQGKNTVIHKLNDENHNSLLFLHYS